MGEGAVELKSKEGIRNAADLSGSDCGRDAISHRPTNGRLRGWLTVLPAFEDCHLGATRVAGGVTAEE